MWFQHLQQSPYCHAHYAVFCNAKGEDVCQCGWVGVKQARVQPGRTFAAMMRERGAEYDSGEDYDISDYPDYYHEY